MNFNIVPADQVPEPSAFGGVVNPIDEEFADFCEDHPGKWIEYPLQQRWPNLWDGGVDGWKKACTRIASSISNGKRTRTKTKPPTGAYISAEGRFETRRDRENLRFLIRWVWDGWKEESCS